MRRFLDHQTLTIGLLCTALALDSNKMAYGADCIETGKTCLDGPSTKVIFGQPFTRDCWRYQKTFQCRSQKMIGDCQNLLDQGCEHLSSKCVDRASDGRCGYYEHRFRCQKEAASEQEVTRCSKPTFCEKESEACFDTSHPKDQDFGQTAALMELARQAGVYGPGENGSVSFFGGHQLECSIKVIGGESAEIHDCCQASSGGEKFTNYMVLNAALSAGSSVARETIRMGSKYVYDTLFQDVAPNLLSKGVGAINSWAGGLAGVEFQPSFNFYGVSFNFSFSNGFQITAFNPAAFAAQVALMLIIKWLSCDEKEAAIRLKRGQGLCFEYDSYCESRFPPEIGICVERRKKHCCFNSKLAKLVNVQGKAQLGIGVENCRGLTPTEFKRLDLSKIDLKEFIADIQPKSLSLKALRDKAKEAAQPLDRLSIKTTADVSTLVPPRLINGQTAYLEPSALLEEAIRKGQAQGILEGSINELFRRQLNSLGPLRASSKVLWRYRQPNCARVQMTLIKDGVQTPQGLTEARLGLELNYCLGGRFPTDLARH